MKITNDIKERAAEIMLRHKIKKLWVTNKPEFFTQEHLASGSVAGDKKEYKLLEVSEVVSGKKTELEKQKAAIEKELKTFETNLSKTKTEDEKSAAQAEIDIRTKEIEGIGNQLENLKKLV